jgi:hypothetical protein
MKLINSTAAPYWARVLLQIFITANLALALWCIVILRDMRESMDKHLRREAQRAEESKAERMTKELLEAAAEERQLTDQLVKAQDRKKRALEQVQQGGPP